MVIAAQITSAAASSSCVSSLLQSSVKQTLKNSVAFLSSGAKLLESPRTSHLSRLPAKLDRSQISVRASSNSPKLTMVRFHLVPDVPKSPASFIVSRPTRLSSQPG
ncbi:unnamed protein product [Closterium sp. NIES-53]